MKYLNTYESFSKWHTLEDFIFDILHWDEILDFYEKMYPYRKLKNEDDLWKNVSNNEFIDNFFEYDTFIEDEWEDLFNEEEDKPLLMSHIKKRSKAALDLYDLKEKLLKKDPAYEMVDLDNIDIDEILEMFTNKELKDIINDILTPYDFSCSLVSKYRGYDAHSMLKDFYSEDELGIDFFKENKHEILKFLFIDEASWYDNMIWELARMSEKFQFFLFDKKPVETAQFLIQKVVYRNIKPLAETYEFQKAFIKGLMTKNPDEIWQDMQPFLKKGLKIHPDIMEEYDLDPFKEAEKFNF